MGCPPAPRGTPLTWFAGDGLDGQRYLGVLRHGERLVAGGEGGDHDVRHVDLLEGRGGEERRGRVTPSLCATSPRAGPAGWQRGDPRLYLDLLLQQVDFVLLLDELLLLLRDLAGGRQRG